MTDYRSQEEQQTSGHLEKAEGQSQQAVPVTI